MLVLSFWTPNLLGDVWFSAGVPSSYRFTGETSSLFSDGTSLNGTPTGYMVHFDFPYLPPLGIEQYQISVESVSTNESIATIDVRFYDICYLIELEKYANVLLGYGYGSIKMECTTGNCPGAEFEEGIARQVFGQLGVLLFGETDFHISVHRVMGENRITVGSSQEHIDLSGVLFAFGIKIGF